MVARALQPERAGELAAAVTAPSSCMRSLHARNRKMTNAIVSSATVSHMRLRTMRMAGRPGGIISPT